MTPVIAQETAAMVDGFEFVDLNETKPDPMAMELVPGDFALKHQILADGPRRETLIVAMGVPQSLQAVDDLGILISRPVIAVLADKTLIQERIQEFFLERILAGMTSDDSSITEIDDSTDLADLTKLAGETAVVQMVNGIFAQAVRDGASDIHIEPYEREVKIRVPCGRHAQRPHAAAQADARRADFPYQDSWRSMNIAERRLPQDGRIKLTIAGRQIDVRVSIVPTVYGERAVMRILDKGTAMLGLAELGMQTDILEKFRKVISLPHGIILATGPDRFR